MARENSGSLSKNKYKKEDKHPDFKGKLNVAGVEYELAGWEKTGEGGNWISISIQIPRKKEDAF
jgi:hypothetical protein